MITISRGYAIQQKGEEMRRKFEGRRFRRQLVVLDDSIFINCVFIDCRLSFAGGECDFEECQFIRPQMEFSGPASNTVALLSGLGMLTCDTSFAEP